MAHYLTLLPDISSNMHRTTNKSPQQKRGSYGPDEPSFSATALLSGTEVAHASRLGHISSLYIRKCRPHHIKEWNRSDRLEGWLTEGFEGSGMT